MKIIVAALLFATVVVIKVEDFQNNVFEVILIVIALGVDGPQL